MTMDKKQREGVLVDPERRLDEKQIKLVDATSRELLENPGLLCYNEEAARRFKDGGATVEDAGDCQRVRIPSEMLDKAIESAPSTIVLGAREPDNRLILDAHEPRVRFGSGSETNFWLDVDFDENHHPKFTRHGGSIERLCSAAHLCDNLENLDFFIRCVNIQDEEVNARNKDVNKFLASLNNITRHVQAGLTDLAALDEVIRLGELVAGGKEAFAEEPVLSFIACLVKSPFQVVDDTTTKVMEVAKRRVPIVISSCPMGGATGPFDEFGMVAQINAEVLSGVLLTQLCSPGTPVLYGAVPVRTRLDNLNDMYGSPDFNNYNMDCAQMARYYGIPCYSTSGVGDTDVPGVQVTVEKLLTYLNVPRSGPQYIHYAFGLLDRTNVFCPVQAVMDDEHIGLVKHMFEPCNVTEAEKDRVLHLIREIMDTEHKSYVYNLPMPGYDPVYVCYPLEDPEGGALKAAKDKYDEIMARPRKHLPEDVRKAIQTEVPNVLPQTLA